MMGVYASYLRGYMQGLTGGRGSRFRWRRQSSTVARALGLQDGFQDRDLRSRAEVLVDVERLLK